MRLNIFKKSYYPLNKITISSTRLIHNYNYLSAVSRNIKIAPVLKSNAYGHGTVPVAKILDSKNVPMFCVDSLLEAYELYKAKIKTPILIMGSINAENLKVKNLPFQYAVCDLDFVAAINNYQPGSQIHIKVDTGMHRLGVQLEDLETFVKKLKKLKNLEIVGLMSHLANPENPHGELNQKQLKQFKEAISILEKHNIYPHWKHLSASGGLMKSKEMQLPKISNLARIGLALYGIDPVKSNYHLKPVLKLTTQIVQIKTLKAGDRVGYLGTFTARKKQSIGVLPIGYSDGAGRRLSNIGLVKIGDRYCRIIGKVSMNITTVDLSPIKKPYIGQEVIVYSDYANDRNSVEKAAQICQTIPYEILVHLSPTSIRRQVL